MVLVIGDNRLKVNCLLKLLYDYNHFHDLILKVLHHNAWLQNDILKIPE